MCLKKQVSTSHNYQACSEQTSFIIINAQSVKNTYTEEEKRFDGGENLWDQTPYCRRYTMLTLCH